MGTMQMVWGKQVLRRGKFGKFVEWWESLRNSPQAKVIEHSRVRGRVVWIGTEMMGLSYVESQYKNLVSNLNESGIHWTHWVQGLRAACGRSIKVRLRGWWGREVYPEEEQYKLRSAGFLEILLLIIENSNWVLCIISYTKNFLDRPNAIHVVIVYLQTIPKCHRLSWGRQTLLLCRRGIWDLGGFLLVQLLTQ